ncbi:MAG: secondary thiamine-phosphate synthase enzyme YjbQ [Phycisphaerae bacterium]
MRQFVIQTETQGNCDIVNLMPMLQAELQDLLGQGVVHLFVVGSTAALTTVEYEPGLVKHDLKAAFDRLVPEDTHYEHEATWHDDNGHSHVRAAMIGPDLTVPFQNDKLLTGTWQQIVLVDFDTRPRKREVICTVLA